MSGILGHSLTVKVLIDADHVLGTRNPRMPIQRVAVVLDHINQTTLIPVVLGIMYRLWSTG